MPTLDAGQTGKTVKYLALLLLVAALWFAAYGQLLPLADALCRYSA